MLRKCPADLQLTRNFDFILTALSDDGTARNGVGTPNAYWKKFM